MVGSLFSSLYGARLAGLLDGRVDPATLEQMRDSVGFTDAVAARVPGVTEAMEVAFMDGLSRGCLVVGLLCLARVRRGLGGAARDALRPAHRGRAGGRGV